MASTRSSVELARLAPAEVLARRGELAAAWTWITEQRVDEVLPRHAARPGFTLVAALDDDRIVGFGYAYRGEPGQWWHDSVAAALTPAGRARWLSPGHVELAELHVVPDRRREGIGGRLHDALLRCFPEAPTAVLSTQATNAPALALYGERGWEQVLPELRFAPASEPYAILGLVLGRS